MSITYTWKVTQLQTRNEGENANAVVQTRWTKTGVDEHGNEGFFTGATPFTSVGVPQGQFVPFEELTEEIVLDWIKAVVVGDYAQHVDGVIAKMIADKATTHAQFPWGGEPAGPAQQ